MLPRFALLIAALSLAGCCMDSQAAYYDPFSYGYSSGYGYERPTRVKSYKRYRRYTNYRRRDRIVDYDSRRGRDECAVFDATGLAKRGLWPSHARLRARGIAKRSFRAEVNKRFGNEYKIVDEMIGPMVGNDCDAAENSEFKQSCRYRAKVCRLD